MGYAANNTPNAKPAINDDLFKDLRINKATIDAKIDLNTGKTIGFVLRTLATPIVDQRDAAMIM
jgi:hypothetical protein